jgi:iron-sulfur cluster assembly protein
MIRTSAPENPSATPENRATASGNPTAASETRNAAAEKPTAAPSLETTAPALLVVTEPAFRRVETLLAREGYAEGGMRVGVKGGGCAGFSYTLKLEASGPRPADTVLTSGKARIYVDPKSAKLLAGTVLEFTDGLNGKGFEFTNPNAVRTCGCGNSFSA